MSINLAIVSYDGIYKRLTSDKVLLNKRDIFDTEEKEILNKLILQTYSDDNISLIPSCQCGALKSEYYIGAICGNPKCGTKVVSSVDSNISFLLWLEQPEGVAKFLSPIIMDILLNRYKISKPSIKLVKYLIIPNLKIEKAQSAKGRESLQRLNYLLEKNNIKRGYNNFIENFYKIVEILEYEFKNNTKAQKEEFLEFIRDNMANMFNSYLPFPNKIMFSMDCNELGKFIDKRVLNPINVIRRVTGIDLYTRSSQAKQLKVAKSLIDLADFYNGYFNKNIFSKYGLIRQHVSGTRCHFTGRAVITSIPGPHRYNEVWLPWSLSCTLLKFHLLNRLYARGYTNKTANALLMRFNRHYHPVIEECFNEILQQNGGELDIMLQRNPSLHRGSLQHLVVPKIKCNKTPGLSNPNAPIYQADNTISMSDLVSKSFNADYDGDSLNLMIVLTEKVRRNMHNFDPHHNVLNLAEPNKFGNAIGYSKTVVSTLANWYNG